MNYRHQFLSDINCTDQPGKVICVGRNYVDHAKELNNPVPKTPLLFMKPSTAMVNFHEPFMIPDGQGDCHHELEMALLIGKTLTRASAIESLSAVVGVGLALDLTLRDVQSALKQSSQSWERAKAFDGACPVSKFLAADRMDVQDLSIELFCNNHLQQSGHTSEMIFPVAELLENICQTFTLLPGDVVLTGTPAGVGALVSGTQLVAKLGNILTVETKVL